MSFPVGLSLLDGPCEGLIGRTDKHRRFLLRPIRMKRVAVTEPVGVVVSNDRLPEAIVKSLQLHRVLEDGLPLSLVLTAQPNLTRSEVLDPEPLSNLRTRHEWPPRLPRILPAPGRSAKENRSPADVGIEGGPAEAEE